MNRAKRQAAVKNAFRSKYTWNNANIVLVDDVLTTNSTVSECIRVLRRDKASEVLPLLIGRDQHIFENKFCPDCENKMVVRTNRKTSERFLGMLRFSKLQVQREHVVGKSCPRSDSC